MNRRQTFPLSRAIEPPQLMVPQREVTVSPLDIGTGALKHPHQLLGLLHELALLCRAQLGEPSTGLKQRRAQTLGQLSKRLASTHGATLGHALKVK